MAQALYRKYRPKSLSEIVGQKHITDTLANAIKSGKISHAYLLTGPRGVGKTSVARILAHEVNGIAYGDEQIHLDIIEIDAASNRRIDEIRNLRDKVHILPTSAKYKVYIIDEVHMLTREAFNALLKTLEEPPEHVIFILATTEAHKLPETIVSRTQHYSFKPIDTPTLVQHLKDITASETLNIDDAALELVAEHGDGSFRDSISLLDQARSMSDHITEADVQRLLGVAPATALDELINIIVGGTAKDLFNALQQLRDRGLQSSMIAKQLSQRLRLMMLDDRTLQNTQTTHLLVALLSVQASAQSDRLLEITLLEYIFANNPTELTKEVPRVAPTPAKADKQEPEPVAEPIKEIKKEAVTHKKETPEKNEAKQEAKPSPAQPEQQVKKAPSDAEAFSEDAWPIVIAQVKKTNSTIYGILRMAQMSYADGVLTLQFKFAFHQKQINEAKNRKIIEDIIEQQTGSSVTIVCNIIEGDKQKATAKSASTGADLDTVSNIFGGGEVLES